jgi:general secretion pathway protein C
MIKRYLIILDILLITAAVYFGVKIFYTIAATKLDAVEAPKTTVKKMVTVEERTQNSLFFYQPIIERNLFKTKIEAGEKPDRINVAELEQTDLKLKLWGTVTGGRNKAYAVIEETEAGKQNLYRTGDSIQNAILALILREKVVLNVNGKDEILEMEKTSDRGNQAPSQERPVPSTSQQIPLERSQIESAVQDANNLMSEVNIRPFIQEGKAEGFILTQIKPNSVFRKMGLRNGDIIIGVDGEKIESMDNAFEFYEKLKSSSSVKLQLKRRGQLKTIDYSIE